MSSTRMPAQSDVHLGWSGEVPVGSGFINNTNTCYLNSSLQALFHVPAFVNWLLADIDHSSICESMNQKTGCLICAMATTLKVSHIRTGNAFIPRLIINKLQDICKDFVYGNQEDAHECLRYLIQRMDDIYLTMFSGIKLDNYSKETTPLNQIFGGDLRSEVTCLECQHVSTTFQSFQDLFLDIRMASSVDDALDLFFSCELLSDGAKVYGCEQCKRMVTAKKQFSIERPPKALCVALNRFGAMGNKNDKKISIKPILDISKFRHRPNLEPLQYKLVSMVSHEGSSSSRGHYKAVGQAATGTYYLFDDVLVMPLTLQDVLKFNPYILIYELKTNTLKVQPPPKKEVISNGFISSSSSSGLSTSSLETKTSTSTINSNQQKESPSPQHHKPTYIKFHHRKKPVGIIIEKEDIACSDKKGSSTKKVESQSVLPTKQLSQETPEKLSKDNNVNKIPLPSTREIKAEQEICSNPGKEHKSSHSLRLVPYLAESSESESGFVPPTPSPSKHLLKPTIRPNGRARPIVHKVNRVRIESEGLESAPNHQQSCNRTDLPSPAGSTSSGKCSVTSTRMPAQSDFSEVSPNKVAPNRKELITLPTPKVALCSADNVHLGWSGEVPVGSGFINNTNTCYLNSSLQALFHVPAFVNWLLADNDHSSICESMNQKTGCLICDMAKTLKASHICTGFAILPELIINKLQDICKDFVYGHQEDAHECLRYLIQRMDDIYLTMFSGIKLDNYSKETTPLNQIFGGDLRSEVTCLECQHVSTTFQSFQDLFLDIRMASSVDDALDLFFSCELLSDGAKVYGCEQCKRMVTAKKQFSIERPPKALCVALKRFEAMGNKNDKKISIKPILDISKFRHRPNLEPLQYKLVSMVSHEGSSSSRGHYKAVGQAATGMYYLFDDVLVMPLTLQDVLKFNPYILIYELKTNTLKVQPPPKKEVISNGFISSSSSSGLPSSSLETKTSTSTINSNQQKESPSPQHHKPTNIKFQHRKKPVGIIIEKEDIACSDKKGSSTKKVESQSVLPTKQLSQETPEKLSKDNNVNKIPLPSTREIKAEQEICSNPGKEHKSSHSLRLVPYLAESSESESGFVPPTPSPSKYLSKPTIRTYGRAHPIVHKVNRVRIESEGLESAPNHQQSCNRTDLPSPAGSTSSGKWCVTSAERENTPEKQEDPLSTLPVERVEKNDRVPNGSSNSDMKTERWDGTRSSSSTMDHLFKTSHRGYGRQVKSWNGGRSKILLIVEEDHNYCKRKCDDDHSYNDHHSPQWPKPKKTNNIY